MAHHRHHHHHQQSHKVVKATTALTLTGSLLVLSALTLSATIIGLVLATPVFVIFSPVLVPAAITIFLLAAGVFTAGGLGITATFVFSWMYKYVNGQHPIGADLLDSIKSKFVATAAAIREKSAQLGHDALKKTNQ
ncbi:oleosin L-like [Daucus carota subsp. sativus]|uniref:oleosin L-like n=1 Tax=Daucus carota subsp. sativus TaxID=79200 RepID=UPI0007EF0022|nr:PREDICTED: oleosin 1-like [Daucus carota subsp. sativus]